MTTDGRQVTEENLIASAPSLLVLYRGWWCPSSKSQLGEIVHDYESLREAGLTIFAASVDEPAEAVPIQQHVGDKITILCNVPESLLDEVGVRDQRGAPWYDRILFGAKQQDIAMPSALVINASGKIVFVYRQHGWTTEPAQQILLPASNLLRWLKQSNRTLEIRHSLIKSMPANNACTG